MPPDLTNEQESKNSSVASANHSNGTNGTASLSPPPFSLGGSNVIQANDAFTTFQDIFDLRSNESELDAYEDAMDAKREFMSENHTILNHMPSTGRGKFDVHYTPSQNKLLIAIRYKLSFINGSATDYPDGTEEQLVWTEEAKESWESRMSQQIYSTWSGHFQFHCQKDWWENLSANTSVVAYKDDSNPHFNFNVTKVPKYAADGDLTFRGSAVTPPSDANTPTNASLDSNDVEQYDKLHTGSNMQTPIAHEAGHMLGLGDEYRVSRDGNPVNHTSEDRDHMHSDYAHAPLVDEQFDAQVDVGSDSRIMSSGDQVENEHGVTFLEALKTATSMQEWDYDAKDPKPVPRNDDSTEFNDGIVPQGDTRYA